MPIDENGLGIPDDDINDFEENHWEDEDWGEIEDDLDFEEVQDEQPMAFPEEELPKPMPMGAGIIEQIEKAAIANIKAQAVGMQFIDHFDGPGINPQVVKIQAPAHHPFDPDIWENKIKEYLYDFTPKSSGKDIKPKKEMIYKTILVENKRHIVHIKCPIDNTDSDEVLWSKLKNGDYDIKKVDSLPNKLIDKINKKGNQKKPYKWNPVELIEQVVMSNEKLQESLDKYYTISSNNYRQSSLRTNKDFRLTRIVKDNHENSICAGYVYVNCTIPHTKLGESTKYIRGFTTGKYNAATTQVEVIGCEVLYNDGQWSPYNVPFNGNCSFKKFLIPCDYVNPLYSCPNEFIRIKIKDYKESSTAFGNARIKKAMHEKVFNSTQFKYTSTYLSKKLDANVPVIDILSEEGIFVKFLASDVEFLYIDDTKFTESNKKLKKSVKIGCKVRIVDNRRVSLEKGNVFTVTNLVKNNSNIKNSRVTIGNGTGLLHEVLLKQIKVV